MYQPYSARLPKDFPTRLLSLAKDLRPLGINELAWQYPDIVEVVLDLASHGKAILGGDVFRTTKRGLELTLDNWYCNRNGKSQWSEFVEESVEAAVRYIETYQGKNEGDIWYSLVFADSSEQPRGE